MLFIKALDGRVGGGLAGVKGSSDVFPNTWACIRNLWGEQNHIIGTLLQLEYEGREEMEGVIL